MYLLQLTDLHIGQDGEFPQGVDVRLNFQQVLDRVKKLRPDRLLLTGDLCATDPDPEIYRWIRGQLDPLGIPYDLIAGNHDDPALLARAFGREEKLRAGELYFESRWENWQTLFLDTAPGRMSAQQLGWLKDRVQSSGPLLVFMHHPPALAGVPHMDNKYAFEQIEEVQDILQAHSGPVEIFCGHYHVEKSLRLANVGLHITPSTYFQIDMHEDAFRVDHLRPGFREIWLTGNHLMSTVGYLEANPLQSA